MVAICKKCGCPSEIEIEKIWVPTGRVLSYDPPVEKEEEIEVERSECCGGEIIHLEDEQAIEEYIMDLAEERNKLKKELMKIKRGGVEAWNANVAKV